MNMGWIDMNLTAKRVLVTGAGGFIGSHLVSALLNRGCIVRAMLHYDARVHRSNLEFLPKSELDSIEIIRGDIRDPHFVWEAVKGMAVVFHLAALISVPYSYLAPGSFVETNIQGTLNILEACRREGIQRLIHTSTSECYGTAVYTPIDEKHPLQGQSPYSASKIGADKLVESYYYSYSLPVAILRPFNTYGPRQSARAVVPTIISQLINGCKELKLGALNPVRDMCYVSDTVDAFLKIAQCDRAVGQVVHIGTGSGRSIQEIAETAMGVVGYNADIVCESKRLRPKNSEVLQLICNYEKASSLLNWYPTVDFHQGIKETANYISNYIDLYLDKEYLT
jgi:NAD dependent epimerase/dehydratase